MVRRWFLVLAPRMRTGDYGRTKPQERRTRDEGCEGRLRNVERLPEPGLQALAVAAAQREPRLVVERLLAGLRTLGVGQPCRQLPVGRRGLALLGA